MLSVVQCCCKVDCTAGRGRRLRRPAQDYFRVLTEEGARGLQAGRKDQHAQGAGPGEAALGVSSEITFLSAFSLGQYTKSTPCRILKDLFISSIRLSWFWIFLYFFGSYFASWLGFAAIWYLIGLLHGKKRNLNNFYRLKQETLRRRYRPVTQSVWRTWLTSPRLSCSAWRPSTPSGTAAG